MADLYSTPELVSQIFEYRDGQLYWNIKNSKMHKGDKAGTADSNGRLRVTYQGKSYGLHRIIFLMHHGYCPEVLDHIDGNHLNNRIENLREATQMQNTWNQKISKNNKSGVKGVHKCKSGKWLAQCMVNGKRHTIGRFIDISEAEKAMESFRKANHGDFARMA